MNNVTSISITAQGNHAMRKAKSFDPSTERRAAIDRKSDVFNDKDRSAGIITNEDKASPSPSGSTVRSFRWKNRLRPGLRRSMSVPEDGATGVSLKHKASPDPAARKSISRRQPLRRSMSVPSTDGGPSMNINQTGNQITSSKPVEKSTFRLRRRPRVTFRSQSLPLEHVRTGNSEPEEKLDGIHSNDSLKIRQTLPSDGEPNVDSTSSQRARRLSLDLVRNFGSSKERNSTTKGSSVSDDTRDGLLHTRDENTSQRTGSSENNDLDELLLRRTKVVPYSSSSHTPKVAKILVEPREAALEIPPYCNCNTSILQHSYLEMMCCRFDFDDDVRMSSLSEDPTVQESIECIFASHLEEDLQLWDDEKEEEFEPIADRLEGLVSPAELLQSRQNRSNRSMRYHTQSTTQYQHASRCYVGTLDPTVSVDPITAEDRIGDPLPCPCSGNPLPSMQPKDWPQAPLLLRPTPGSGTRIKGVRFGGGSKEEPLWVPGSHLSWSECLAQHWGSQCGATPQTPCCEKCAVLPINNGNEPHAESLVIDFDTDLFEGTLLLRLRFAEGTTKEPYDDNKGYFVGMNRRYQALVRGRFKQEIPLTELVTGFQLERPCGKLPAKWIVKGGLKVLSFFAPQLQAKFDCNRPYSLTPLGSTPQSIRVDREETDMLEDAREEPTEASMTLLGESSLATSSLQRARARKKAFDKLYVQKATKFMTDPSKTYTFEFLQHLFNFQDFSVELGSMLGSVQLEEILDGQPLQIMAAHGSKPLWSFDVWHQCLLERANHHTV